MHTSNVERSSIKIQPAFVRIPQTHSGEIAYEGSGYSEEGRICQDLCFPWHGRHLVPRERAAETELLDLEIKDDLERA